MTDQPLADDLYVQPWGDLLADEHEYWLKLINEFNLPPLVTGELSGDGDLEPDEIAHQLAIDPLLAAKVLAVANSAAMGRAKEVFSLEQAVVYMGSNLIQTIIAGYRMEELCASAGNYSREFFRFVQVHSAASAVIAHNIAGVVQRHQAAEIGTAALLSRMGALLYGVQSSLPGPEYQRMSEVERLKHETDTWGITAPVLSGRLTRHWGLPEELCQLLEESWEPVINELPTGQPELSRLIVAAANTLAGPALTTDRLNAKVVLDRSSTEVMKQNLKAHRILDRVVDVCASTVVQRELMAVKNK